MIRIQQRTILMCSKSTLRTLIRFFDASLSNNSVFTVYLGRFRLYDGSFIQKSIVSPNKQNSLPFRDFYVRRVNLFSYILWSQLLNLWVGRLLSRLYNIWLLFIVFNLFDNKFTYQCLFYFNQWYFILDFTNYYVFVIVFKKSKLLRALLFLTKKKT